MITQAKFWNRRWRLACDCLESCPNYFMLSEDELMIRARVQEFIKDFYDWNTRACPETPAGMLKLLDWTRLHDLLQTMAGRHFVSDKALLEVGNGVSWSPAHDPN